MRIAIVGGSGRIARLLHPLRVGGDVAISEAPNGARGT